MKMLMNVHVARLEIGQLFTQGASIRVLDTFKVFICMYLDNDQSESIRFNIRGAFIPQIQGATFFFIYEKGQDY